MLAALLPANEIERLGALRESELLKAAGIRNWTRLSGRQPRRGGNTNRRRDPR
jgi:hypothetical protein